MTKCPDWCPEDIWAWSESEFTTLYEAEPDLEGGCENSIREMLCRVRLKGERDGVARSESFLRKRADEMVRFGAEFRNSHGAKEIQKTSMVGAKSFRLAADMLERDLRPEMPRSPDDASVRIMASFDKPQT